MPEPEITLKEYVDFKIEALETSIAVAKVELNRRLDGMNEFRDQLKEQAAGFITRPEHESLCKEVQSLRESRAELAGKASQNSVNIATVISVLGILLAFIGIILGIFHI